jgi:fatty-acyl-CoA synthase
MPTIKDRLVARIDDPRPALVFEDRRWTYAEYVRACAQRASHLLENRLEGPLHVGVLLENVPEYPMWLGAAALAGATVVGVNPTRRGPELARDITHTDCQLLVTDASHRTLLEGLDLGAAGDRILEVESPAYAEALRPHEGAPTPEVEVDDAGLFLLIFTSGTSGAPKACLCSQGRLAISASILVGMQALTDEDVCYCAMPLFHSNALIASWAPAVTVGATCALRRRFSASGFLSDVRRYGVTYFNYVGKPLAYILATPERRDDGDNTLIRAFGNEATERDVERFQKRFGCKVSDYYGSTEGGVNVARSAEMPPGSLGRGIEGVVILDADTGEECPPAKFGADGELLNPGEAIGELANKLGAPGFEGYWKNDEASASRVRDGIYWSGDLAYRDAQGFIYFAGRDFEWLRVDGENFAAAPVERILSRFDHVVLAAVYAVPDEVVGDQVMAALQLEPGVSFEAEEFEAFLSQQSDLGTKWTPRYVRICEALPATPTNKLLKRQLRNERWECGDPLWWKPEKGVPYRRLSEDDRKEITARFAESGRSSALEQI